MKSDWRKITLWGVVSVGVGLALWDQMEQAWAYAQAADSASASDSLPLYLGARAVRLGMDPTDAAVLQEMYVAADLSVTRALFSVLYPPSMHVMLQPIAGLSYGGFLFYWRQVLLGLVVLGTAVAGTVGVRGARIPVAMTASALAAFVLFPTFVEVQVALGQPNPLVAGIFGLAMGFAAQGWLGTVAVLATVGAGIKLVPAIMGWPLLTALRWRAVAIALGSGVLLVAATTVHVPLDRIVANLQSTAAFQQTVEPHWLHDHTLGDWARFLGFFRRTPMLLSTVVLAGWATYATRALPQQQQQAIAVSIALLATALAADSTGVGAYYATMAIPGMAAVLTWPLSEGASRWSWLTLPLAFSVWAVVDEGLIYNTPNIEAKLVLACTLIWSGLAVRLITLARPWSWRARSAAVLVLAAGLVYASIWTWRPPFRGHKTLKDAAPGSQTTPEAPPVAPIPRD